jgi:hypothetical protein
MMKKLKFLVTAALLLFTSGAYADDKVTVSAGEFTPGGDAFQVVVSLENTITTTVAAYQMVLYLPEGFSINRYYDDDDEEWKDDCTLSSRHKTGHGLGITKQADGGYLFLVYANPTKTLKSSPAELFTLGLKAASTVTASKEASFTNVKITSDTGVDTNLADVDFDLTIKPVSVVDDGQGNYNVTVCEVNSGVEGDKVIPANVLDANGSISVATFNYTRVLGAPSGGNGDATIDGDAAKLYTTCLPKAPATADNVKYYTLSSVSGSTLIFAEVSTLAANTPYLVAVKAGDDMDESQSATNITLKKEADNSTQKNGFVFKGTLTGLTNAEAAAAGAYILQDGNKWCPVQTTEGYTDAYIPPFRAYIVAKDSNASSMLDTEFSGTTDIRSLQLVDLDGQEHWYDLNGRRIVSPMQKGVHIYNGKKVIKK